MTARLRCESMSATHMDGHSGGCTCIGGPVWGLERGLKRPLLAPHSILFQWSVATIQGGVTEGKCVERKVEKHGLMTIMNKTIRFRFNQPKKQRRKKAADEKTIYRHCWRSSSRWHPGNEWKKATWALDWHWVMLICSTGERILWKHWLFALLIQGTSNLILTGEGSLTSLTSCPYKIY